MLEAYERRRDALERALTACSDAKAAADCLAGALEQVRMETRAALPDAAKRLYGGGEHCYAPPSACRCS